MLSFEHHFWYLSNSNYKPWKIHFFVTNARLLEHFHQFHNWNFASDLELLAPYHKFIDGENMSLMLEPLERHVSSGGVTDLGVVVEDCS